MKTRISNVRILDERWMGFKHPWTVGYISNRALFGNVFKSFITREAARNFARKLRNIYGN